MANIMRAGFNSYEQEQLAFIEQYMKGFTVICLFDQPSRNHPDEQFQIDNQLDMFIGLKTIKQNIIKCYSEENCIERLVSLRKQKIILIVARDQPLNEEIKSIFGSYLNIQYITSFKSDIEENENIELSSENKLWLNNFSDDITEKRLEDCNWEMKGIVIRHLLRELLLRLPLTEIEKGRKDFIDYSRFIFNSRPNRLIEIDEYETDYQNKRFIQWYTGGNFVHRIVNKTLREGDINSIYKIRHTNCGIYTELSEIYAEQLSTRFKSTQQLHRARFISQNELEFFQENNGKLVITNSYVSTSIMEEVAARYITGGDNQSSDKIAAMFHININVRKSNSKPIGFIAEHSQMPNEDEVLLASGIVLRIVSVTKDSNNIWQVVLERGIEEENFERKFYDYLYTKKSLFIPLLVAAFAMKCTINDLEHIDSFKQMIDTFNTISPAQLQVRQNNDHTTIDCGHGFDQPILTENPLPEISIPTILRNLCRIIVDCIKKPVCWIPIILLIIIVVVLSIVLAIVFHKNTSTVVGISDSIGCDSGPSDCLPG